MRLRPDVDVDAAAVLVDGTRPTRRTALRRLSAVRRSVVKVVINPQGLSHKAYYGRNLRFP